MSSDSDSDNDAQIKKFLEAADTTLLNNSMFQKSDKVCEAIENDAEINNNATEGIKKAGLPKSQRYIEEDNESYGTDFNLPESMQKHLAKQLSKILKEQYEFYDVSEYCDLDKNKNKFKSRVKLFKADDCYVKPYEKFNYETKGPEQKPVIKRRIVDKITDENCNENEQYKSVAVDGNYILSGAEVKMWAKKKVRKDKVFFYKMSSHGVLNAKEDVNDFTELRRINKWNENKIKNMKHKNLLKK